MIAAVDDIIASDGRNLSAQLHALRESLFPPSAQKALRRFSSGEAARLIGVTDGYLRQLSIAGEGPMPDLGIGGHTRWARSTSCAVSSIKPSQASCW